MPVEMDVPFRLGADGRVVTRSDPDAQVRLHVLALVNTSPAERVTVPGYGVPLNQLLFENTNGEDLATLAGTLVSDAFANWESGVTLTNVTVNPDDSVGNRGVLDVAYKRKATTETVTNTNVNTALIGPGGVIREIVRG